MIAAVVVSVYAVGFALTVLAMCHHFADDGELDLADVGVAAYVGFAWPILAPFLGVALLISKALPFFGIKVSR